MPSDSTDLKFCDGEIPTKGQVVLCPSGKSYRRGVVDSIQTIGPNISVKVLLLEFGNEIEAKPDVLFKPNEEIMKVELYKL